MEKRSSIQSRRTGVIINFSGLLLAATVFFLGEYGTWNWTYGILGIAGLTMVAVSYVRTYGQTGILALIRSKADDLDEREIQVTHEAYRISYGLIGSLSLLIIVFIAFSVRFSFVTLTHRGHYSFGLIAIVVLNYIVYTLPAAILAWREPNGDGI